jgi:hypothetical protein
MSVCLTLSNKVSNDTWKTKIPLIDGFGTEGIGSMIQYHLLLQFLSDSIGVEFTYPGSTNFSHYSYTEYSEKDYFDSIDSFFNFPNIIEEWDEVITITEITDNFLSLLEKHEQSDQRVLINLSNTHREIENICRQNMSTIFTQDRINKIKNNLIFKGKKYFTDGVNVSFHIRTPNPNDIPVEIVSPLRELYSLEKDFVRYKNLINFLKENFDEKTITLHIHSQGFTTDFSEFLELQSNNFKIKLHIDDHPISDIYHMANADLFIMSNSSFSWISSLLNPNQKIMRDNFTNGSFVHNALRANYDYTEII